MCSSHKNSNTIWLVISSDTNEAHQPCMECTVVIGVETTTKLYWVDTRKEVDKTFQYYVR